MTRAILLFAILALLSPLAFAAPPTPPAPANAKSPLADPNFFPIGVWGQRPRNAAKYKELGVNLYLSIDGSPTDDEIAEFAKAGVYLICHRNDAVRKLKSDAPIIGWMHGDEPDNFVKDPATDKYVPKAKPDQIIADYQALKKEDPTRPVLLNLGQGVANIGYKGGWAKDKDYGEFVQGCDIVSYDIYPACSARPEVAGKLELIASGMDRIAKWTEGKKIAWFITEASAIHNTKRVVTAPEMRAEVWMALTHGATGIVYFCHQWEPKKDFALPLGDKAMGEMVAATNKEILALAPVLNSPTTNDGASVKSLTPDVPVDILVKQHGGATYIFAVCMRNAEARARFTVKGYLRAGAEVLGENRILSLGQGGPEPLTLEFADTFKPYAVHHYKITPRP